MLALGVSRVRLEGERREAHRPPAMSVAARARRRRPRRVRPRKPHPGLQRRLGHRDGLAGRGFGPLLVANDLAFPLQSLVAPGSNTPPLSSALDISDGGDILAPSTDPVTGEQRVVLLTLSR